MFSPKLLYQLTFEGSWPTAVTFLDSERRVAAGNQDGLLYVWELPEAPPPLSDEKPAGDRKPEAPNVWPARRLDGHTNMVSRLLYDAKRKQIISASFDHSIRYWAIEGAPTGTAEAILDGEIRRSHFKRTKKEDLLKAPGVPVQTYASSKTLAAHEDWVQTLGVSGDGARLISGDAAAHVVVWDVDKGEPISRWRGHSWNWIVNAQLTSDGQTAAVSEFRYKRDDFDIATAGFKLWNVADGTEKLDILKVQFPKLNPTDTSYGHGQLWRKFTGDGLVAMAFSPDGKLLAAGQGGETDTGKAHLIEVETGKLVRDVSGHQYGMTDLCFSRDGKLLFTAGRDTCVRITQVEDGKEVAVLGAPRGGQFKDWISAIALSADETHLAAADIAGHVSVWKLNG
jgi:WD40 repeat protein